jgi:hypothetical protein
MTVTLDPSGFPSRAHTIRASWVPIMLCPRIGSPENFVIGVAALSSKGFHLAEANAWRRLRCLYDDDSETALMAARVALETLKTDLAGRGIAAFESPKATFSGVTFGKIQTAEGVSEKQIATSWLQSLSSLYDNKLAVRAEEALADATQIIERSGSKSDRLPVLVLEFVQERRPGLVQFFSSEIRERARSKRRPKAQDIYVGFNGSRLAANFATLPPTRPKATIDHIKRLMWDLEKDRDSQNSAFNDRKYEMIIKHQARTDPHISMYQFDGLLEVIDELGAQGLSSEIQVVSRVGVPEIGEHVIQNEFPALAAKQTA